MFQNSSCQFFFISHNITYLDRLCNIDFPDRRSSDQVKHVWDELNVSLGTNDWLKIKTISEEYGIRRSPETSRLSMGYVNYLPLDNMNQCLLGFVLHFTVCQMFF